jgi:hypothetical protein
VKSHSDTLDSIVGVMRRTRLYRSASGACNRAGDDRELAGPAASSAPGAADTTTP